MFDLLARSIPTLLVLALSGSTAAPEKSNPDQEAARADEALLKEHQVGLDDAGLLEFFRQRTLTDAGRQEVEKLIRQLGDDQFQRREQAARDLVKRGPAVLRLLQAARKDSDPEIARRAEQCVIDIEQGPGSALPMAVLRVLAQRKPAGAIEVLLRYVPFANEEGIEDESLNSLIALTERQEKVDPVLVAALKDPAPLQRAVAAFALGRHKDERQRAAVLPLLTDADGRVRLRAAQGLALGGEKTAVPVLIALLADGPEELVWRAEEMLLQLAGEKAPDREAETGNALTRAARRDAWLGWWKEHGERVDLGRLTQQPESLGLTLCIEWNRDRIYECGRDRKVRWQLNVSGPLDAQMLTGNRILIAESGGRVTERDLKGNILWEYKVEGEPLNCQRLPNGNTFIGTRNTVMEVTRGGRIVFRHAVENAPYIHGISRTRSGHYVYINSTGIVGELDATGRVVRSIQLEHEGSWGAAEALPGGRYLVCNYGTGRVFEIDAAGKILWERKMPGACGVTRLPNGNLLVACSDRAAEIDRTGRILWERTSDGFVRRAHRR